MENSTSDPTSMMWPLFQGRTCMPTNNPNGTCTLGGYASYSINVGNVAQIQLGVNFARNANLRLAIKNTGHDYIGKSSGAGALNIWMHNLKDIQFVEKFSSDEYMGPAFKTGAGVQGFEILEAVKGQRCYHPYWNLRASIYGMAADQVLAFEVVTADGRFVTASNSINQDLFWALRGGGGSTFGIVTSAIVKAHPRIHVTKSVFSFQAAPDNSRNFWKALHAYFKRFPQFTSAGTYSYFFIWNFGTSLDFRMAPFFAPNHTLSEFHALTKPFFDDLAALNISVTPNTTFHEDFYSANKDAWGADTLGVTSLRQATRLFPKSLWVTDEKFEEFFSTIRNTVMSGHTVLGYQPSNPGNPVQCRQRRESCVRKRTIVPSSLRTQCQKTRRPHNLKNASDTLTYEIMAPWRKVAPASEGGGVYLNEADIQEPRWQEDFYGVENYPRLLAIKRRWDPRDVFYATTGVGSEAWEVRDGEMGVQTQNGRLCRV
ncbi:hypothetical protein SNOG_04140 [Parastagonospora nodorum SN15]|uniref:FAD-binding PCMH-type domain-containing protein n=1 Tax=Phaeosphaeria nodorum (strain SN15 / ATCC MYA-4574 / FGSC 10173) TaxID=321614 RepID=Q0UVS4_PHANO|nr:hypothetical protein SNOG_04140 [Parastagonospora nodorum SN15]EAT87900.2 hypothetical protein SNOG_04140 [Parastagonospora nodorum SN15]